MTAWDDYLTAARRLDSVRRQAASVVDAETASTHAAREELATVRRRLDVQRGRLLDLARHSGLTPLALTPAGSGADLSPDLDTGPDTGSAAGLGTDPGDRPGPDADLRFDPLDGGDGDADGTGPRALRAAVSELDAADAILSGIDGPRPGRGPLGSRPPALRNSFVYGGFALVVMAVQVTLFITLKHTLLSVALTAAGAILPLLGFGLSWLVIGLLFGRDADGRGRLDRTPLLGAAISLAPVVVLCAGVGAASLFR